MLTVTARVPLACARTSDVTVLKVTHFTRPDSSDLDGLAHLLYIYLFPRWLLRVASRQLAFSSAVFRGIFS